MTECAICGKHIDKTASDEPLYMFKWRGWYEVGEEKPRRGKRIYLCHSHGIDLYMQYLILKKEGRKYDRA